VPFKRSRPDTPGVPGEKLDPSPERRRRRPVATALLLLVALIVAGAAVAVLRDSGSEGLLESRAASAAQAAELPATSVVAAPGAKVADGTRPLTVTLSGPVAPNSPEPTLRPAVAGSWTVSADSEVFTPASTLKPCTSYQLTIWADTTAAGYSRLGRRRTISLQVACPPIAGMQQALARLGYLAAKLRPLYTVAIPSGRETRAEAAVHAFDPPRGRLAPDPADAPPVEMGKLDAVTKGALTVYQSIHGLPETGEPDAATWASVLSSEAADRRDPDPYTWVSVTESLPETLEVHRGHHVVFSTPANTGVPGAETERGIFPIYSRFVSTTMSGTDVDGTKYKVPDVPWVNYFNGGDAVHGYPRASYGFPQSNGCVELPIEAAHTVFGMLRLGDIVEVT
jgi:peptidoglycan hydrolase-like protein with peptidoglycan-binding domain